MADKSKQPKIGAGHASAMYRQGLAELRGAVYPSSNIAQPPQYGLYGTRTPGEVMEDKELTVKDPDEVRRSVLDEKLRDAEARQKPREDRSRDISRE